MLFTIIKLMSLCHDNMGKVKKHRMKTLTGGARNL